MKPLKSQRWLYWIGAALVATGLVGFYAVQRQRTSSFVQAAGKAMADEQFDEARKRIDDWLRYDPHSGQAEYTLALLELKLNRPAESLEAIRLAGEWGYDKEKIAVLVAILGCRGGQYQSAEKVLWPAFESNQEPRAEIAEAMTSVFLTSYRLQEASRAIDRWIDAAPNDAKPYVLRHEILQRLEATPSEMIRNLRMALDLDPSLDKPRLAIADLLLSTHANDESEAEYEAYVARNPSSAEAHAGLGQIAALKGDMGKAVHEFEEVLKLDPNNQTALQQLSLIDLRGNNPESACIRLKKALESAPFDVNLHYNYATALRLTGNKELADQETALTNKLRADLDAVTELRKELLTHPEDYDRKAEVMKWLIDHGQEKEGLKWSELILKKKPRHSKTCEILAEYYDRNGQTGLANYYRTLLPAPGR